MVLAQLGQPILNHFEDTRVAGSALRASGDALYCATGATARPMWETTLVGNRHAGLGRPVYELGILVSILAHS